MSTSGPYTSTDVLVLHATDVGWLCEIEDRRVFVGKLQIEPGTKVPSEGHRGPLTIRAQAINDIRDSMRHAGPR